MLVKYSASAVCPSSTMCFDVWKTDWWLSFGSESHDWTLSNIFPCPGFSVMGGLEKYSIFSRVVEFRFLSDRSGWSGIKATINPSPRAVGNGILLTRDYVRDTSQQRTRVQCSEERNVLKLILMVHPRYGTIRVCAGISACDVSSHLNVIKLEFLCSPAHSDVRKCTFFIKYRVKQGTMGLL